jgi:hypothetical protein
MALTSYETLTAALLQSPSSPTPLIPTATLDTYIHEARLQVAAQGACIREYLLLSVTPVSRIYSFTTLTNLDPGVTGIYHIRQIWFELGAGQILLTSRPFEWFSLYHLNNAVPKSGQPAEWAQFGQGEGGSIFIDPVPDGSYTCLVDALGLPAPLVNDASPEPIPAIWILAVPFYAAWLGYMSRQRQADADRMMQRFQEQMALARSAANPDLLPENWVGSTDPMMANRLGAQKAGP